MDIRLCKVWFFNEIHPIFYHWIDLTFFCSFIEALIFYSKQCLMIESGFTYLYWPFLLLFLIFIKTPEELNSQVFSGSVKSISRNKKNTWNLDYQVFKRVSIMIASFSSAFYRRNRSKSASPLHCRGPKNTLSIWSRWVL